MCSHAYSLWLRVQEREAGWCSEVGEEARICRLVLAMSPIHVREIEMLAWFVAPEPRISVRNICSSACQAHALCDGSHQNVAWSLSVWSGVKESRLSFLEFTRNFPMTAGSIQALPSPFSSQIFAILFRLLMTFPLPSSPRYPHSAEQHGS